MAIMSVSLTITFKSFVQFQVKMSKRFQREQIPPNTKKMLYCREETNPLANAQATALA